MAYESTQTSITLKAGADLSGHLYRFVKMDANGDAVPIAAATDKPIGVLQNKPNAAGERATVLIYGVTKMEAHSLALNEGVGLSPHTDGRAQGTNSARYTCGVAITAIAAGNAGKRFSALIDTANPHKGD